MNQVMMEEAIQSTREAAKRVGRWYFNRLLDSSSLQMLFVCGHMRSGSSLLVHILNSNPVIVGYGETHHKYLSSSDFGKPALSVYWSFKRFPYRERYVLDKVVHTPHLKDPTLLRDAQTVFLIRRPEAALSSLLEFCPGEVPGGGKVETAREAFDYYTGRLEWIREASASIPPALWTFITYQDLVNQTERAFRRIEGLLSLKTGLTSEYKTTWATGHTWVGDHSERIQTGKIVSREKRPVAEEVKPFIEEAQNAFDLCLDKLRNQKNGITT
jgi:hypothetical protein